MARGACTFRQRDVTAAIKAVRAAGVEVARVRVDKDGAIVVEAGRPEPTEVDDRQSNEWDDAT